jgi:hypothetical protein
MAVNSRDIVLLERELRGHVDPRVLKLLIKMNEDLHAHKQMIMQLAALFDKLADNQIIISNATQTLQNMMPHIQRMKQMGMEVGSDPTLTGEHDEK